MSSPMTLRGDHGILALVHEIQNRFQPLVFILQLGDTLIIQFESSQASFFSCEFSFLVPIRSK